jgi:hypothetical protein
MILSHGHRFIAFKTRKTGGTSFEIALSKYVLPQDIVTPIAPDDEKIRSSLGYPGPQNHSLQDERDPEGTAPRRFTNHVGAAEVRSMVPAEVFDSYVKVAIVRNPFDVAVSWYFWERSRTSGTSRDDFRNWLAFQHAKRPDIEADYRLKRRPNPGVFSSNRFITHIGDRSAIDCMLRYEHLQEDAAGFARRVGLPASLGSELGHIRAKGNYRPAEATAPMMFEGFEEGKDMIRTVFAEDIAAYGYDLR